MKKAKPTMPSNKSWTGKTGKRWILFSYLLIAMISLKCSVAPIPPETLENLEAFTQKYCEIVNSSQPDPLYGRGHKTGREILGKNAILSGDIKDRYTSQTEMPEGVEEPNFIVHVTPDSTSEFTRTSEGFSRKILVELTEPKMANPAYSGAFILHISDSLPHQLVREDFPRDSILDITFRKFREYVLTGPLIFTNKTFNLYRWAKVDAHFDSSGIIPVFASRIGDSEIIYVSTQKPEFPDFDSKPFSFNGKFGVTDTSGRVILPLEYDFIHTFGALLPGLFEIEQNGRSGFADIQGNIILPPEYDYLLPTGIPEKPLFIKQGNKTGYLNQDRQPVFDSAEAPDWRPYLSQALPQFSHVEKGTIPKNAWLSWAAKNNFYRHYYVSTPASFVKLRLSSRVNTLTQEFDPGVIRSEIESKIEATNSQNPEKTGFLARLERWVWGPRQEFHEVTYTAHTASKDLKTLTRKKIYGFSQTYKGYFPKLEHAFKTVGKDTFEISFTEYPSKNPIFLARPGYLYLIKDENGGFRRLTSRLPYPFLEFARLDSSYLNVELSHPLHIRKRGKKELEKMGDTPPHRLFWERYHYSTKEIKEMIRMLKKMGSPTPTQSYNLQYLENYLQGMMGKEDSLMNWQTLFLS